MIIYFASGDSLVSEAIKLATLSQFSHCAISANQGIFEATMERGVSRTNYAEFIKRYPNPHSIIVDGNADVAETWLMKQLGKEYDYAALAGFVFRRDWQNDEKWFCSELVAAVLIKIGLLDYRTKISRVTPRCLWYALKAGRRI